MEIAITGMASLVPGGDLLESRQNMENGSEAMQTEQIGENEYRVGRIDDAYLSEVSPNIRRRLDRISAYSCVVAQRLVADASLSVDETNCHRVGSIFATFNGSISTNAKIHREIIQAGLTNISPMWFPSTVYNAPLGAYTRLLSIKGVSSTLAGADPIYYSKLMLESGQADIILVVATDEINDLFVNSYANLGLLRKKEDEASVYSGNKGFVYSESFSGIVLETVESAKKRGAKIYGTIKESFTGTDRNEGIEFEQKYTNASPELVSETVGSAIESCNQDNNIVVFGSANGTGVDSSELEAVSKYREQYPQLKLVSTKVNTGESFCPGFINNIISALLFKQNQISGLKDYLSSQAVGDLKAGSDTVTIANQYLPNGIFSSVVIA